MRPPLVALTAIPKPARTPMGEIPHQTLHDITFKAIVASGGIPTLLPSRWISPSDVVERFDAIVLTGGGDVDPSFYDAEQSATTVEDVDRDRDSLEIEVVRLALNRDLPLLGICRGHQLLNVALGGSLRSDIPSDHWDVEHWTSISHSISVDRNSRLGQIFGPRLGVNSIHHQAIDQPGTAQIVATSSENIAEAIEAPENLFVIGVQWHPEFMTDVEPTQQRLFDAFIHAAKHRKGE